MILKASQRSGARSLADHLMNERDNDHLSVVELRGFVSDSLSGAFSEAHAISKATQCKQFLFSMSLNPPIQHNATEDEFIEAVDRAEQTLGLNGQPRAIVVHEKEGRRHAHVVWSRIDADAMKAINFPHFKNKLRDLSRDLFLDHGWVLPNGLASYGNKSPLNFTLEEWQQAKRQGVDPREIKHAMQQAWKSCDSQIGFKNALEDRGYFLARGDRRGFVALDVDGNIYAIAKWAGLKAKDVKAKIGAPDDLPSVDEVQSNLRSKVFDQMRGYINQIKDRQTQDKEPLRDQHRAMKQAQRLERKRLKYGQEKRWSFEITQRSERLNKGLRGLFDVLSGKAKVIRAANELEATQCAKRDQKQRDFMVTEQIKERRTLQRDFSKLERKHQEERRQLAQSIKTSISNLQRSAHQPDKTRRRDFGFSI